MLAISTSDVLIRVVVLFLALAQLPLIFGLWAMLMDAVKQILFYEDPQHKGLLDAPKRRIRWDGPLRLWLRVLTIPCALLFFGTLVVCMILFTFHPYV